MQKRTGWFKLMDRPVFITMLLALYEEVIHIYYTIKHNKINGLHLI